MNNFLDFLIAVFTGLTALISLRQMFTQLPFVRAQIYDIPNSTMRNTVAEKMQMEGYFMLQISVYEEKKIRVFLGLKSPIARSEKVQTLILPERL